MFYFTIALILFLIGLTQYIMNKHFNISLQGIALRIVRSITSPGYYDHHMTAIEIAHVEREHTAWLNEQEAKHDAWVLRAARPLDIEEKEAEYYAHQRKEKAKLAHAIVRLDEYGQECDENGTPYWILK